MGLFISNALHAHTEAAADMRKLVSIGACHMCIFTCTSVLERSARSQARPVVTCHLRQEQQCTLLLPLQGARC